jgi:hypothetical protein
LEDQSGTHEYTSPGQIFAFADSPVDLRKSTAPLLLYAYQDTSGFKKPTPPKAAPKVLTKKEKKEEKERVKRIIISGNISNGMLDLHNPFEMSFAIPIISFDSSKIRLTGDSFQNITNYHFTLDSTNKKLTLHYALKPNTGYHLILQKDFATDSLDDKLLKVDTIAFRTKKESDYAILRLRFKNLDLNRHPVLLFVQGDKIILSYKIGKSLRYNNKLFDPGEYEVRILYDTNQNGVWDPGDFYNHIQPEIVVPLRKKFYVKTGWENEEDIIL